MAQDIYVDPDATGLADGTSWTDAYTSLETVAALNLDATGQTPDGNGYGILIHCRASSGTADTISSDLGFTTSWTTDATHWVWVGCDASDRADGVLNTAKYRLVGDNAVGTVLTMQRGYFHLDGIQVQAADTAGSQNGVNLRPGSGETIKCTHNIIYRSTQTGSTNNGIRSTTSGATWLVGNNVIIGFPQAGLLDTRTSGAWYWYNNTIVNCGTGMQTDNAGTSTVIAINNIVYNCTTAASGTFIAGTTDNATDLSSMNYTVTGGGNSDETSVTFNFNDTGSLDYSLTATTPSGITTGGSDLDSDATFPITDDITGTARDASTPSIGAFEYVAAGGGSALPLLNAYYHG